jgi:hypothetical protein
MKLRLFSVLTVFAAFTIYTSIVVMNHGYTGFIELALTGGWGAQVFIDLCIALLPTPASEAFLSCPTCS